MVFARVREELMGLSSYCFQLEIETPWRKWRGRRRHTCPILRLSPAMAARPAIKSRHTVIAKVIFRTPPRRQTWRVDDVTRRDVQVVWVVARSEER
jgi:hypothetical protein